MIEKLIIIGNAGKDAEMRYTPSGQAVTSFSVATNKEFTNQAGEKVKRTKWFRVSVWGKLAEVCNQYVKKGMTVYCEGELQSDESGNPRIYTKADGTTAANFELTAQTVRFLSRVESGKQATASDADGNPANEDWPF